MRYLLLFFPLLALVACTDPAADKQEAANAADTISPRAHIRVLSRRIAKTPQDYLLYQDRASWYHKAGNTDSAIVDMSTAIGLYQDGADLYYERGAYAFLKNDTAAAMRDFRRAAQLGTTEAENFYQMGQIFHLRRDYTQALNQYNNAIKLDSGVPVYFFAKGLVYEDQKQYSKAAQQHERALTLDPGFVKSLSQLYKIYTEYIKDPAKAKSYADRILTNNPGHPFGRFLAGNIALDRAKNVTDPSQQAVFEKEVSNAIMEYTVAINKDSNFVQARYNRGYCFFLAARYDDAIRDFEAVVKQQPSNAKAHFMLGSIHEYYKDRAMALQHYEAALKADPAFGDAQKAVNELKRR